MYNFKDSFRSFYLFRFYLKTKYIGDMFSEISNCSHYSGGQLSTAQIILRLYTVTDMHTNVLFLNSQDIRYESKLMQCFICRFMKSKQGKKYKNKSSLVKSVRKKKKNHIQL